MMGVVESIGETGMLPSPWSVMPLAPVRRPCKSQIRSQGRQSGFWGGKMRRRRGGFGK